MITKKSSDKIDMYLDELAEEYKKMLLQATIEKTGSVDEISISEMLRLDNEVKKQLLSSYRKNNKKRKTLGALGMLYVGVGLLTLLYSEMSVRLNYSASEPFALFSLVFTFAGVMVCIWAYVMPVLLPQKEKRNIYKPTREDSLMLREYEIIAKWRDLEGVVNEFSTDNRMKYSKSVISFLQSNKLVDPKEVEFLKNFLQLRNQVVHASELTFSDEKINSILKEVNIILEKLKKRLS